MVGSIQAAYTLPEGIPERISDLTGQFGGFARLAMRSAMDISKRGTRPHSVKPIRLDIRSGKLKYRGTDDAEQDSGLVSAATMPPHERLGFQQTQLVRRGILGVIGNEVVPREQLLGGGHCSELPTVCSRFRLRAPL